MMRLPFHEGEHQVCFSRHLSIHQSLGVYLAYLGAEFYQLYFDEQLVSGQDRVPEPGVVYRREIGDLVAIFFFPQHQAGGYLRHRFDYDNSGHHRVVRKMTGEIRFRDGNVFESDDRPVVFNLQDSVYEEERMPVGDNL